MNAEANYLLAIESAISGGSIALYSEGEFVAGKAGSLSVSRAEDLLPNIIDLLAEAKIDRADLSKIAISLGPGSYTGLRIGISTVMGLCRGLGIDYVGVPVFEAVARKFTETGGLIVLPMGKTDVCLASTDDPANPRIASRDGIGDEIRRQPDHSRFLAHSDLIAIFEEVEVDVDFVDIGTNLASYVGEAALDLPTGSELRPIYIQNPRFG